ncbi:hypothetical protein D3C84_799870 [compost metagenome]
MGQVVGIVRIDAHARRVAIERMPQFHSAIGFAAPQFGARLDDQHPALARQTQQLRRQHRAAEAAADDQDVRVTDGVGRLPVSGFTHAVLTAPCLPG